MQNWAMDLFLRIGFVIFILPTLAYYVPNLDPIIWLGIFFGIIILFQNLTTPKPPAESQARANQNPGNRNFGGQGYALGNARAHQD